MTIDLKPIFDAARTADDEVQHVLDEVGAALKEGTEEGNQKALDLRPTLEAAEKKAKEYNQLYISVRNAQQTSDAARKFIPVQNTEAGGQRNGSQAKEMNRSDFEAMDSAAQMKFAQDGGIVIDPE